MKPPVSEWKVGEIVSGLRVPDDPVLSGSKLTLGWVGWGMEGTRRAAGSGVYIYHGNKVNLGSRLELEGRGTQ